MDEITFAACYPTTENYDKDEVIAELTKNLSNAVMKLDELKVEGVCESCGETVPNIRLQHENLQGGAMCDDCAIASWKDRAQAIAMSVMADNSYHEQLRRELTECQRERDEYANEARRQMLHVDTVLQQLEATKLDAERYRWVMDNLRVGEFNGTTDDSFGFHDYSDAEIDAARKEPT